MGTTGITTFLDGTAGFLYGLAKGTKNLYNVLTDDKDDSFLDGAEAFI
jgi:hypothetical protein